MVVSWGLTDKDNWVTSPDNHERRQDGSSRPLPFDSNYIPKPAYVAISDALSAAPPR
jgi:endo-1,4-beta-xylanase